MPTVISCYEIPNDSEPPLATTAARTQQLFRAVAPGTRFGYLEVAEFDDGAAALDAARTIAGGPVTALSGSYQAFHVNDRPAPPFTAAGTDSPIIFINCLQFSPDRQDAAFEAWKRVNDYMVTKPGYRWHRLHRRTHDDAPFGFVNVVEWDSAASWEAAHDAGFRALTAPRNLPFVTYPTVCAPVPDAHRPVTGQLIDSVRGA
ncbi:antibiotic biosynthesis monooxygenase family protein [Jatrophihabitans sp.]|jgi:heme-degrading monooxygenase HmoA|uniref:antibiotic biosynthesis monooxygenase family protein n=1 Tax=Jatrophihabitans sp. TaxID=1932789 RepID=UPI002EFDE1FD